MLVPLAKLLGAVLVALVAIRLLLALLGAAITLAGILLFVVAPLALLGWIGYKIVRNWKSRGQITASDEVWLQGKR